MVSVTGVADPDDWIRHSSHHRAARIEDPIALTEEPVRLTAKRHGISVACVALDGALDPQYTPSVNIGFQQRQGRRVWRDEGVDEVIVPVENDHAITAKVKAKQLCGDMRIKCVPGAGDGTLDHGRKPRIVRLEDGVIVRPGLAVGKGVIDRVAGNQCKVILRVT
jgi:hypothetical protein